MRVEAERRNPVEALAEEFIERRRRGEQVSIDNYANAHPELAGAIRRLFPAVLALEQCKTARLSASGNPAELNIEPIEQLGDFRIIREIGRGGMGVVYEAEQQSLRRRVAVKLLPRQSFRDPRRLERFHREARTAARLHHTNIVPVFGVGEQDGWHYYVMQIIDGISLDQIIDPVASDLLARPASDTVDTVVASADPPADGEGPGQPEQRGRYEAFSSNSPVANRAETLEATSIGLLVKSASRTGRTRSNAIADIGIQVASALRYAHSQGVLHRDIKPSNLLLDPRGRVWITDFGLATVLGPGPLGPSLDLAGTLRYMAPEHIDGRQDARSDLYSLGLTLYELLTFEPAFDDPNRESLVARIRRGNCRRPRELHPEIPRDLEAVVLKAMAPDREQRYLDADALAADLQRFVEDRPVQARPVGAITRLRQWSIRNPAVSGLSAALMCVAIFSLAAIGLKWREAVAESQRAEGNLSLALESMDQILSRFTSSWMAQPVSADGDDGESAAAGIEFQLAVSNYNAAVLQDALKFYDQFARQNPTNPRLQRDTAKVHRRVADIYQRLGQYDRAIDAYRRSLSFLGAETDNWTAAQVIEKANTLNQLGLSMYARSQFADAESEFGNALRLLKQSPAADDPDCQAEQARVLTNLAQTRWLMFRRDDAKASQEQAVTLLEHLVEEAPQNSLYRLALARAYHHRLVAAGRKGTNQPCLRDEGISILEQLTREYPSVPDFRCELSEMLCTSADRAGSDDDPRQQIIDLKRSIELAQGLTSIHPTIPRYRAALARATNELAEAYREADPQAAEKLFAESVELYRNLSHDFSDIPVYRLLLSMALDDESEILCKLQRTREAIPVIVDSIAEQRAYVSLRPDNHFGRRMLARRHQDHAEMLTALGQHQLAAEAMQEHDRLTPASGAKR